ncbi:unnamed protein product [Cylindrotheca closterium]|uniref:Uncharacterized protein n=1 Tax=Cylindrotheca closterium TaxID=2856 RepID=A0AAD2FCL4_9STRA|nr:unnamed protein product [Cylindrotheca closterium]
MTMRNVHALGIAFATLPLFSDGFTCPTFHIQESKVILLATESTGPKASGRRRTSRRTIADADSASGPRASRPRRERPQQPAPFDGKAMTAVQDPNEGATPLNLHDAISDGNIKCMSEGIQFDQAVKTPAFKFMSLDDLFGKDVGLSTKFNAEAKFREDLRIAIRQDIFDSTPFYASLSEKAASVLLLPDSSLEGSWRMPESMNRMNKTTAVLAEALGESALTGDELMKAIGDLCGSRPSTHFIDIYGVQDRAIGHSFHMDFGKSPLNTTQTVLWGWPREDDYNGCGVFSHVIPLEEECWAPENHPRMEPVLFSGSFEENNIVRPRYQPGRELLIYRDVDVVHSAPDVTYRTSVMRFM